MNERTERPRVVMMVANTVAADTRVKKAATAVDSFGYDVTLLGISPTTERQEGQIGGVRLVLLPIDYALRNAPALTARAVEAVARRSVYSNKQKYEVASRRIKVRQRELEAARGQAKLNGESPRSGAELRRTAQRAALSFRFRRIEKSFRWSKGISSTSRLNHVFGKGWRSTLPEMHDFELAFGRALDELKPDIIHAHDVHLLGVAIRAKQRAAGVDRHPTVIYDSHEYVPGLASVAEYKIKAFTEIEDEYIDQADRIITVSPMLADWLERDHSPDHPVSVVMNMPANAWNDYTDPVPSLRREVGVGPETPLMVYSGGFNETRGVRTLIEAMPDLPEVHLALVALLPHRLVSELLDRADELGCGDRVHTAPFVQPQEVARYLSEADVGVHPMLHAPNHEVALPNKYFEYLHARLPLVVSDVESMAAMTRKLGVGEVFTAGDPAEFAAAVRKVLADREVYRANITDELVSEFSWETQAEELRRLYADVDEGYGANNFSLSTEIAVTGIETPQTITAGIRPSLLIGPTNSAGQSTAWARALEANSSHTAQSFALHRPGQLNFPVDIEVSAEEFRNDEWSRSHTAYIASEITHLLLCSGRPITGRQHGNWFSDDIPALREMGKHTAVLFHGSEARNPRRHAELEPASPFRDPDDELTKQLQRSSDEVLARVEQIDCPMFITTAGMLDYLPSAAWLPPVIDLSDYQGARELFTEELPVVLHAPSHSTLKGSSHADAVCRELEAEGLIRYQRVQDVPQAEVARLIRSSDIVLDQFALGDYGVMALQALAAGRLVIGHVADRVRNRLPEPIPIIESTGEELSEVLRTVLAERDTHLDAAKDGTLYAFRYHDGRVAGAQLRRWLDGATPLPISQIGHVFDPIDDATLA